MDTTKTLIEALRAHLGGATNYGLAKYLGIAQSAVGRYVKGVGGMSYEIGLRVAVTLQLPEEYVLLCLAAEREQASIVKPMWQRLAAQARRQTAPLPSRERRRSKVAAVLLASGIAGLSGLMPRQAQATPAPAGAQGLYIMENRRRAGKSRNHPRFARRIRRPRRRVLPAPASHPIIAI